MTNCPLPPPAETVAADVARALAEDVGPGDVTADLLPDVSGEGYVVCKQSAVIAGGPWFDACLRTLDPDVEIDWRVGEGEHVESQQVICSFRGRVRALVTAERTALNFLQTLSATATVTAEFVAAVAGTRTRILDTRKTLPGLRLAQKYAVRAGGGENHRLGLHDAMMLKENHIHAAGSIAEAVASARRRHPGVPMIVEVETLAELEEALQARPDRILLDEFSLADLHEAVRRSASRVPLEISGGVDLDSVRVFAATGVDCISIGALTKHVRAIDLSLRLGAPPRSRP